MPSIALAVVAMLGPASAWVQSSRWGGQLPRQPIDGGANRATSASWTRHDTIGQPDAKAPMTSASCTVRGGFHLAAPAAPLPDPLLSHDVEAP